MHGGLAFIDRAEEGAELLDEHVDVCTRRDAIGEAHEAALSARGLFEQRSKELRHRLARLGEGLEEGVARRERQRAREGFEVRARGDRVALVARPHVHPVLDPPKEGPRVAQRARLAIGREAQAHQPREGLERARDLELGVPPAPDQLERLHEELGLPDPSAAQLHVRDVVHRELAPGALEHLRHVAGDLRIDRATEHEGPHARQELRTQLRVTRDGPGPQQHRALPRAAEGFVVALGARQGIHDGAARPLGTKPQIDPKDEAVLVDVGEDLRGARGDASFDLVGAELLPRHLERVVGLVEEAEVDVAPEVELTPAQLAHAQADPLRRALTRGLRAQERDAVLVRLHERGAAERELGGGRCQRRHLARRGVHVRQRAHLAESESHQVAVASAAERLPHASLVAGRAGPERGEHAALIQLGLHIEGEHVGRKGDIAKRQGEQGRGRGAQGVEEGADVGPLDAPTGGGERLDGGLAAAAIGHLSD
jgi:hypothetical protein